MIMLKPRPHFLSSIFSHGMKGEAIAVHTICKQHAHYKRANLV